MVANLTWRPSERWGAGTELGSAGAAGGRVIGTEQGRASSLGMYPAGPVRAGRTPPSHIGLVEPASFFHLVCLSLTSYKAPTHTNTQARNTPRPASTSPAHSPPHTHVHTLAPTQTQHGRTRRHVRRGLQPPLRLRLQAEPVPGLAPDLRAPEGPSEGLMRRPQCPDETLSRERPVTC